MKRIVILTLTMLLVSVCLIGCANHPSAGSQTSDTENQATVSDTENNETVLTTDNNDTCIDTSEDTSNETLQNSCKYNLNYNDICGYYFHKIDGFYFNRGVYNCFSKMNASDIGDRPETKAQWELEYYNAVYNDSQKPCDRMFVTTLHFIRDYNISKLSEIIIFQKIDLLN